MLLTILNEKLNNCDISLKAFFNRRLFPADNLQKMILLLLKKITRKFVMGERYDKKHSTRYGKCPFGFQSGIRNE